MKNNIDKILKQKGVSIRQLSFGINMDYSNTHDLVRRESLDKTHPSTLLKVAEFLDVDIDDLYSRRG